MADKKLGSVALCPTCDAEISFKNLPTRGQRVVCHRCNTRLIVIERSPIELDLAVNAEIHSLGDSTRDKTRDRGRKRRGDDDWNWEYDRPSRGKKR